MAPPTWRHPASTVPSALAPAPRRRSAPRSVGLAATMASACAPGEHPPWPGAPGTAVDHRSGPDPRPPAARHRPAEAVRRRAPEQRSSMPAEQCNRWTSSRPAAAGPGEPHRVGQHHCPENKLRCATPPVTPPEPAAAPRAATTEGSARRTGQTAAEQHKLRREHIYKRCDADAQPSSVPLPDLHGFRITSRGGKRLSSSGSRSDRTTQRGQCWRTAPTIPGCRCCRPGPSGVTPIKPGSAAAPL